MKKLLVLLTVTCFVLVGCGKSNSEGSADKAAVAITEVAPVITEACSVEMASTYQYIESTVNSISPCLDNGNYCSAPTVTYLQNWVSAFKNDHGETYACVATENTPTEIYKTTDFDELLSEMAANI